MNKPQPPPYVPGATESERFDNAVRAIFAVSKEELTKREAEWKKERTRKRKKRKQTK